MSRDWERNQLRVYGACQLAAGCRRSALGGDRLAAGPPPCNTAEQTVQQAHSIYAAHGRLSAALRRRLLHGGHRAAASSARRPALCVVASGRLYAAAAAAAFHRCGQRWPSAVLMLLLLSFCNLQPNSQINSSRRPLESASPIQPTSALFANRQVVGRVVSRRPS